MKLFFLAVYSGLFSFGLLAQTPYEIYFPLAQGHTFNMNFCQGKKIMVTVFDASSPDISFLSKLDSIQNANSNKLIFIAVPIQDLGTPLIDSSLYRMIRTDAGIQCILPAHGYGGKSYNNLQHPLLKWVTHVEYNKHFDRDILSDGQIFMIDEQGELFGSFGKTVPVQVITAAVNRSAK
jgi:hypothetical protein